MNKLLLGVGLMSALGVVFWLFLPKPGRRQPLAGSELLTYVAVGFSTGGILALALVVAGIVELLG